MYLSTEIVNFVVLNQIYVSFLLWLYKDIT